MDDGQSSEVKNEESKTIQKSVVSEEQTRNKFATTTILSSSSTTNHRYK